MRLILAAMTAFTLLTAGCAVDRADFDTDATYQEAITEKQVRRDVLVAIALDRIERFNAMGIDPIQLDTSALLALDTACVVLIIGGVEFGLDVEYLKTITAVCDVIMKAAAEYKPPIPDV